LGKAFVSRAGFSRLLAVVALAGVVAFAVLYRDRLDVAAFEAWVRGFGMAGPFVFMAFYALGAVAFLPGSVLTLAGGALFGPVWGTFYNLSGATLGATLAFLIARFVARDWVTRKAGGRLKQLLDGVESEGWRFVAFTRLVPLFPFNLLNYALGLTRIGLLHYFLATFVFMLPGAIAYTYLGYAGREAATGAQGTIQKGLLALALLALAAFLPRLVKRLRTQAGGNSMSISANELKNRLEQGGGTLVLDVRPAADYAGALGRVPGSTNVPLDQLVKRIPELERWREREIAVICRTNRASGEAAHLLRDAGFRKVLLVSDGMIGWQNAEVSGRK
jgi:uncharacterized membrane protein YdjX (TVP38/TMEM64 family)